MGKVVPNVNRIDFAIILWGIAYSIAINGIG
jgi:hypothetical protein